VDLAHRSPQVHAGARALLDAAGLTVVGTAADGRGAILAADELRPRVLLLDARIAGIEAVKVAALLRRARPDVALLALVGDEDAERARLLAAVGVRGVVPLTASADELADAVRAVAAGEDLAPDPGPAAAPARSGVRLTAHQAAVLRLLAMGWRNREIAAALGVEEGTVAYHVAGLMRRLAAHTRAEAVYKARLAGLEVGPPPVPPPEV
jgi:DNA-binding NarL/FixJ family response regulator